MKKLIIFILAAVIVSCSQEDLKAREDYMKEHPESSFLVVSYNNKDKVGTSFLLGSEEDIAKECTSLMLYKKEHEISRTFSRVFNHLFRTFSKD